jgi:hypothetical protein
VAEQSRDWWRCTREGSVWHHGCAKGSPQLTETELGRITSFWVPKWAHERDWTDSLHAYASKASCKRALDQVCRFITVNPRLVPGLV